jgi:predicted urease superfamily metal-dependent hydrolase
MQKIVQGHRFIQMVETLVIRVVELRLPEERNITTEHGEILRRTIRRTIVEAVRKITGRVAGPHPATIIRITRRIPPPEAAITLLTAEEAATEVVLQVRVAVATEEAEEEIKNSNYQRT